MDENGTTVEGTAAEGGAAPAGRSATLALLFLTSATGFLFALQKVHNFDIWWHLRTGAWILENRTAPVADPFSFTTPGADWVPHYWLSDALFALVHGAAGMDGLLILKAAAVAAAFGVAFLAMVRQKTNPYLASLLLVLAVFIGRFRFLLRPHVVTFLFAAVFFLILNEARQGRAQRRRLLWLLPLMALWANLHGGFALGIVMAGCLLAEEAFDQVRRRAAGDRPPVRSLVEFSLLLPALAVVSMATPYGVRTPLWVVQDFLAKSVSRSFQIQEHLPLGWGQFPLFWTLMIVTGASFLLAGRKTRVYHLALWAAATVLAIKSIRYVGLAAMLQAPVLGWNLQAALDRAGRRVPRPGAVVQALVGFPLLLVVIFVGFRVNFSESKTWRFGVGVQETYFPAGGVRFLEGIGFEGNVYNTWKYGGYLLWNLPGSRNFIDGRSLDAQLDFYDRYARMSPEEFDALLVGLDTRAALVDFRDPVWTRYMLGSERFRLAYFDDRALVYLRGDLEVPGESTRLLDTIGVLAHDFSRVGQLAAGPDASRAEEDLRHAVSLSPGSFKPRLLLGAFLESQGRAEALDQFMAAIDANPRLALLHYGLGRRAAGLALSMGRWVEAVEILESSLRLSADNETRFLLATARYKAGDHEGAESLFLEILEGEPRRVAALSNLGYLYLDTKRFPDAASCFSRALEADPASEDAAYGLALTEQSRGNRSAAKAMWLDFLQRFPRGRLSGKAHRHLAALAGEPTGEEGEP